jgi:hypothetical protein
MGYWNWVAGQRYSIPVLELCLNFICAIYATGARLVVEIRLYQHA